MEPKPPGLAIGTTARGGGALLFCWLLMYVGSGATATERERALEDVMSARLSWLSAKDSAGLPALADSS